MLVSARDEPLHPGPILVKILQLHLTDPLYSVCRKNGAKHSAYEKPPVSDMKQTVELKQACCIWVAMQLCFALHSSLRYGTDCLLQLHSHGTTASLLRRLPIERIVLGESGTFDVLGPFFLPS